MVKCLAYGQCLETGSHGSYLGGPLVPFGVCCILGDRSSQRGTLNSVGPCPAQGFPPLPSCPDFTCGAGTEVGRTSRVNMALLLQGSAKELSPAALEKRRRRKQERDRKKRKRKELRAKEKAAKAREATEAAEPPPEVPGKEAQGQPGLLFNKVRAGVAVEAWGPGRGCLPKWGSWRCVSGCWRAARDGVRRAGGNGHHLSSRRWR